VSDAAVLYDLRDEVAVVTMNRPEYRNAQNGAITYGLDDAFTRAAGDDAVKVVVLAGAGEHFSAGHDIGSPGRDAHVAYERRASMWWDHTTRAATEGRFAREQEVYLGMCRRWRDIPKPTLAMVHGACVAGGLMLAWVCDLIIACEDAYFQDPVGRMGIPGVEYFAHGVELPPRIAKEFILLGERMSAERALQFGMVNRVVPREQLEPTVTAMATELATRPRLGNWLTKQALNHVEDLRGKRTAMDAHFHMHHFAHAQNDLTSTNSLGGLDAQSMAAANKRQSGES